MFSLQFLGAAGQVTGSKYFLRTATHRGTMVDCGLFQGPRELREMNWNVPPIQISDVHNLVLTHAHLDHTGYLPKLVQLGFRGQIWCTPATHEVAQFILRDCAHLQEEDAAYANKKGYSRHKPALPLYTSNDVEKTLGFFHVTGRGKRRVLPDDLSFEYFNAGHILGSSFIKFEKRMGEGEKPVSVLFSGDIGRERPIYLNPKAPPPAADYIVCESTYGDRLHHPIEPMIEFGEIIKEVVEKKAVLIIPAFAVDRAQELIYCLNSLMLQKEIPEIPTYVDSPMATGVTALYEKYCDEHTMTEEELSEPDSNPLSFRTLHFVQTPDQSKNLNKLKGPAIIISASGMATGGRVQHHLANRLPDPASMVLFTGYQAEETLGRQLIEGADSVSIRGERVQVRADVRKLNSFSGHADQSEIIEWLRKVPSKPKRLYLTHGEDRPRKTLKAMIEQQLGWDVYLPRMGEVVELS